MAFPYKAAPVRVALANVHVVWYLPRSDELLSFEGSYHRLTWHAKWAQRWLRERWWMSAWTFRKYVFQLSSVNHLWEWEPRGRIVGHLWCGWRDGCNDDEATEPMTFDLHAG